MRSGLAIAVSLVGLLAGCGGGANSLSTSTPTLLSDVVLTGVVSSGLTPIHRWERGHGGDSCRRLRGYIGPQFHE
jgi:hypothetical protein